ncbi:hypothetical protein WUBG_11779 [Wuchereria bancrofti]|uniref:Uncharacterized protein n=1 Tax=Wuchereria bancrofti TaxID=6293 RepID=J9ASC1_WUCBA|nr:hypothetical protein WUBG_11779 [Wuchereria bancrofti]
MFKVGIILIKSNLINTTRSNIKLFLKFVDEKENKSKWLICSTSHRSLPYAPSSNSTVSSISTETIPSVIAASNSTICSYDDSVQIISKLARRSYTLDCSDIRRIRNSCRIFDGKIPDLMDNRSVIDFQQQKTKEFPLQSDNEMPILKMQMENPVALLIPKTMNKRKSLSASWLIDEKKVTEL